VRCTNAIPQPTHRHWAKVGPTSYRPLGKGCRMTLGQNWNETRAQRWPNVRELYRYPTLFQRCYNVFMIHVFDTTPFLGDATPPFPFLSFPWPPPSPVSMPFSFPHCLRLSPLSPPTANWPPKCSLGRGDHRHRGNAGPSSVIPWRTAERRVCLSWHRLKAYIFHKSINRSHFRYWVPDPLCGLLLILLCSRHVKVLILVPYSS